MGRRSKHRSPQVTATGIIWGCATGMLAICIPLVDESDSGAWLPLAVVAGAATGTVAVWRSPQRDETQLPTLNSQLPLEQRVANLEAICSSSEFDLPARLKQLETRDRV
jgi:hypothetical protein